MSEAPWWVGALIAVAGVAAGVAVAWINRSGGREDRIVTTIREDNKVLRGRVSDLESREYTFLNYIYLMQQSMAAAGIPVPPFPEDLRPKESA